MRHLRAGRFCVVGLAHPVRMFVCLLSFASLFKKRLQQTKCPPAHTSHHITSPHCLFLSSFPALPHPPHMQRPGVCQLQPHGVGAGAPGRDPPAHQPLPRAGPAAGRGRVEGEAGGGGGTVVTRQQPAAAAAPRRAGQAGCAGAAQGAAAPARIVGCRERRGRIDWCSRAVTSCNRWLVTRTLNCASFACLCRATWVPLFTSRPLGNCSKGTLAQRCEHPRCHRFQQCLCAASQPNASVPPHCSTGAQSLSFTSRAGQTPACSCPGGTHPNAPPCQIRRTVHCRFAQATGGYQDPRHAAPCCAALCCAPGYTMRSSSLA